MKKNYSVECLRGFLIIIVILYHYIYRFNELFDYCEINIPFINKWGVCGVAGFFIISSFYFLNNERKRNFSIIEFLKNKIIRLYPTYFLAITIIFIYLLIFKLNGRESNIIDYFLNIFFINGFIGTNYIDGAHWYLTYTLIFLIFISFYIKYFSKYKKNFLFFYFIIIFNFILRIFIYVKILPVSLYMYSGGYYLQYFIIGISINKLSKKENQKSYFIMLILSFLMTYINHGIFVLSFIIIFSIIFYLSVNYKIDIKSKILNFMGMISYVIYLFHQNIGYQLILSFNKKLNNYYLSIIFTIIIIVIFCYLIYNFYEKRIQEKIKKNKVLVETS